MMMPSVRAMAEGFGVDMSLKTRAGYSIGASSPYGMPAAIVGIEAFRMTPSFRVGVDVAKPVDTQWAVSMGFFVENKTMDVSVRTKGYHMEMRRGAEGLEGVFTGHVSQQISMLVLTLPVCATFSVSTEVNLRAGVYGSLLMNGKFSGHAQTAGRRYRWRRLDAMVTSWFLARPHRRLYGHIQGRLQDRRAEPLPDIRHYRGVLQNTIEINRFSATRAKSTV